MRILVTGNCGYIGSLLTPALEQAGHEVVGMDTSLYRGSVFGEHHTHVPTLEMDIRDVQRQDLAGIDSVIHLAGLSNDPLGAYRPELTDAINHRAAVHLARLAKDAGAKRFLFASSCSNYGAAGDEFLDEGSPFRPVTPYGKSKADTEFALSTLADDEYSPTYLRASTAYGVSPLLRFDLVLNNLVAWAYTTARVHLKSDGTPWRPIVHIRDIALAYVVAAAAPREIIHDRAFNVGSTAENYRISELAKIVSDAVPGSVVEYAPDAGPDKRCYRVDCNRIARELPGFKPQWTARRGVMELLDAFRAVGITLEDVEGARYSRITHIRQLIEQNALSDELRWIDEPRRTAS